MAHLYYDDSHLIGTEEVRERCNFCDDLYWPSESSATAREKFCSDNCETDDREHCEFIAAVPLLRKIVGDK